MGWPTQGALTLLYTFDGETANFDTLEFEPATALADIRYLRIVTTVSPSWVAWRGIEDKAP